VKEVKDEMHGAAGGVHLGASLKTEQRETDCGIGRLRSAGSAAVQEVSAREMAGGFTADRKRGIRSLTGFPDAFRSGHGRQKKTEAWGVGWRKESRFRRGQAFRWLSRTSSVPGDIFKDDLWFEDFYRTMFRRTTRPRSSGL